MKNSNHRIQLRTHQHQPQLETDKQMYIRGPNTIQEPEENENIKTTIEELEVVVLFVHWPDRKVYIGTNLIPKMKPLKKQNQFEWSEECQQALKNLKSYLSNPPLLAKPKDGEKLLVYLAVSEVAVSAVLVREVQGLGIVLVPPTSETIRQAIKYYPITNNEVEYEAVIVGLELTLELGIEQGTYTAREARMQQYLKKAWDLVRQFQTWKVMQIPREENAKVDTLANLASAAEVTNEENASDGILLEDKKKAQALCNKTARYCLKQGNLYLKMFYGPLARCLGPSQIEYVMREIHEVNCGNHTGGRSLVKTMIRAGYYWPKMEEEVENFVAKDTVTTCIDNNMHRPTELLHLVVAPWPFMKWGIDIVGPLLEDKGKVRFLLVLTDYFTKWVEAGAFKHVREKEIRDFIWRNIICRFGVTKKIVCDNGPQFIGAQIAKFFQSWRIKRITSTPYHPVGNGQAESTNKVIINNLKKRLEESKVNWSEVLPEELWAYQTTTKMSTGETPFSLVYGAEALIPVEIGEPSTRYTQATEESNEEEMRVNLDLLEERRENALKRMAAQKQVTKRY
uniref:Uncharacterized protein LOC104233891 n=1 Tax=Nicotiana sylvestris TaxID=4096 RepID=A0A1U7XGS2_NICSY|nr:PREDICTED: uncharacterized protein LOC104233891 [Nicotiana sylvestris]